MSEDLTDYIGAEQGQSYLSDWLEVDQPLIDRFADTTRDWNSIHIDAEQGKAAGFGGTIAHGFLLLSLLAPLRSETPRPRPPGVRTGVNYGLESVRFVSPVVSGSRIRAQFTVSELRQPKPGQLREVMDVTLEIEGQERPAVVARWLTMYLL